jgi:hypothetical protein
MFCKQEYVFLSITKALGALTCGAVCSTQTCPRLIEAGGFETLISFLGDNNY